MTDELQNLDPTVVTLLPRYLANRRDDLKVLQESLVNRDFTEIRRLGHNIKGSGGSYGLDDFSRVGQQIEMAAIAENALDLPGHFEELENCIIRLVNQLEEYGD